MFFNSFLFLFFFLAVVLVHFALKDTHRWVFLLAASYYFYMCWKIEYVFLILASTLVAYVVALLMEKTTSESRRRWLLYVSLGINLGVLFLFKYANFVSASIESAFESFNFVASMPRLNLLLPVGISFYTFQTLSYSIDVYRGDRKAERHFGYFATYVSFFPQLVAGPIERSTSLLPQFRKQHRVSHDRFRKGGELILWGLFKKMAIADLIAPVIDSVYTNPELHGGPILLLATFLFSVQIYCDFSGYSDIAIGAAKMLGYDLMVNFRQPYFATSIAEFWQRWHISLSTWFRDYMYFPLGGNRVSTSRWCGNVMAVFLVSGLWHGASWTFVAWGALHGTYLLIGALFAKAKQWLGKFATPPSNCRLPILLAKWAVVYVAVLLAWVFFRANSIEEAFWIVSHLSSVKGTNLASLFALGLPRFELVLAFVLVGLLLVVDFLLATKLAVGQVLWSRPLCRHLLYCAQVYCIVFFGVLDKVEFIYFQF